MHSFKNIAKLFTRISPYFSRDRKSHSVEQVPLEHIHNHVRLMTCCWNVPDRRVPGSRSFQAGSRRKPVSSNPSACRFCCVWFRHFSRTLAPAQFSFGSSDFQFHAIFIQFLKIRPLFSPQTSNFNHNLHTLLLLPPFVHGKDRVAKKEKPSKT